MGEASSRRSVQSARAVGSLVACATMLAGCSDDTVQLSGLAECRLSASIDGWVEGTQNDCGIQGSWYSYNDCPSDASPDAPTECTQGQQPGKGDFENRQSWMCTCGTTAPAPTAQDQLTRWGAGIALDLNAERSGLTPHGIGEIEADRRKPLQGFSFRLVGTAPGLRVNFPTPETKEAPHAMTVDLDAAAPSGTDATCLYDTLLSTNTDSEDAAVATISQQSLPATALFRDAKQDARIEAKDRMELDRGAVTSIQFYIPSSTEAARFNFCIGGLTALY
jgi:hypothetical protein